MVRNMRYSVILAIITIATCGWNKYTNSDKDKDGAVKEETFATNALNYEILYRF